ncbi:MAG: SGNH/GDSL hydrolase family protein [Spirochaetia bacterium]|jgi:lysophospholipase L1-like esterase
MEGRILIQEAALMFELMCFGDSNTWGYAPRTGDRYPRSVRWTGVLQASLGSDFLVIEEGLNGRTTVWEDQVEGDKMGKRHLLPCLHSHAPLDLVILLLGTNDLKKRYSAPPCDIAAGAGVLMDIVLTSGAGKAGAPPAILLLAPPPLAASSTTAFGGMFEGGAEKSRELGKLYREAARLRGCSFIDTGAIIKSSEIDGIHLDEREHQALGQAVAREVRRLAR